MITAQPDWHVFPEVFLDRLKDMVLPLQLNEVLESFCQIKPTTFRVNSLKMTAEDLQQKLSSDGFELESVTWLPGAFVLRSKSLYELTEHELYKSGCLYVQSLSSMLPPLVLDPEPGDQILDVAAAPGSKTTQMAAMMNNQGSILANDTSLVRLFKLQANLEMQGVEIVKTRRGQGQNIWQEFPEMFDKTLVDVPCSMEGRFNCAKPKTYENWSLKKNKELMMRQRALLRSAVSATKPGGTIVYSTCTLSPEENEMVVDWVLKKEGSALQVEPVELSGVPWLPALPSWKHKVFEPGVAQTARILPSQLMEGFYVAKFKKLRSTVY